MSFRVVTYNILADAYVKPNRYPLCSAQALEASARRRLLLDRLLAMQADVLCLQEVEAGTFAAIQEALAPQGVTGFFEKKHGRPDGAAIFVQTDRCEVSAIKPLHYEAHDPGDDQVALVVHLRREGHDIAVASTHLRWQQERIRPAQHLGRLQLCELLAKRDTLAPGVETWIITGDMNANSDSCVIQAATAAGFKLSCKTQRPWDTTNINGRRRKLDYLLYNDDALHPVPGRLPKLERDTPMPSLTEPSDHLAVSVDFRFDMFA